jgi:hypothetical protein
MIGRRSQTGFSKKLPDILVVDPRYGAAVEPRSTST